MWPMEVVTEGKAAKAKAYLFLEYYPVHNGETTLPEGIRPGVDVLWQVPFHLMGQGEGQVAG